MDGRTVVIERFFSNYSGQFTQALAGKTDAEATAASFADCFIEAGPNGISCGHNDEVFRQMIPRGYEFYRSIGMRTMSIEAIEVSHLDALHSIARVRWSSTYRKKDGTPESIAFEVIYLVQERPEGPKIFAYITGDEQAALREKGLIDA